MAHQETKALIAADRRHILHPYQLFDADDGDMLPIEGGAGARIIDTEGREYIDGVGGLWCTNIGLGRQEMVDAIATQISELAYANPFVDMTNVPAVELAQKLSELSPGSLNHVFFTCGGSTAIDSAFRLIQYYWSIKGEHDRQHMIARTDAYHGTTMAAISLGGRAGDRSAEFSYITDTIHHLSSPNFYHHGGGRTEQEFADDLVAEFRDKVDSLGGPQHVAAFFAEPIMGAGGVIMPPADYLQQIWSYCQEHGILYVSDEVVTGFGRIGQWFVSESIYGIQPDMITSAKGLTSGYLPLGALLFSDEIFEVIAERGAGRQFGMGYTYSGHPVSCAAALKNIEIMEREGVLEHVRDVGPYFMAQLEALADLPMVGDVRGSHLMVCLEFVADKETRRPYPDEVDIGKRVADEAEKRGLIVRPIGNMNVMSPSLVITRDDVDEIVNRLRESIVAAHASAPDPA